MAGDLPEPGRSKADEPLPDQQPCRGRRVWPLAKRSGYPPRVAGGFGRLLMVFGVTMVIVGFVLQYGPLLGKLPGDLQIERGGFRLLLPLGSCLAISLLLTAVLQLFSRLR
jgi:hypothetical protein